MQTKNIISVAAAVASFCRRRFWEPPSGCCSGTGTARADCHFPWSGDLYAGYASNYTCAASWHPTPWWEGITSSLPVLI